MCSELHIHNTGRDYVVIEVCFQIEEFHFIPVLRGYKICKKTVFHYSGIHIIEALRGFTLLFFNTDISCVFCSLLFAVSGLC